MGFRKVALGFDQNRTSGIPAVQREPLIVPIYRAERKAGGTSDGGRGRPLAILGSYVPIPGASGPCSPSDAISNSPNRTRNASVESIAGYLSKGLLPAARQAYRRGETQAPSALKKRERNTGSNSLL